MKSIYKFSLLFFAFVVAAQSDPVLLIFDPLNYTFDSTPPTQSVSVEGPGGFLTLVFEASGSILTFPPSGPSDLYGFSFDVSFNPSQLQVVSNGVNESGYFAQNGIGIQPAVNNTTGSITDLNDFVAGPGPGENLSISNPGFGADPLVAITFRVIGSGTSYVTVPQNSDLFFADSNGNFTSPIVGTEEVISPPHLGSGAPGGGSQTPEPSSAQMLMIAGSLLVVVPKILQRNARLKA